MSERKGLGTLIVVALAAVALALPAAAQDKPRHGGELVFVVPSEPPSYDAHREETFGVIHPLAPHYNGLLRVDPNDRSAARVVGDLAESWTISKDGRTYTFKLRRGVKFHDGSTMTAEDVKFTLDRIWEKGGLGDGQTSPRQSLLGPIKSVDVVNGDTLRVTLSAPWSLTSPSWSRGGGRDYLAHRACHSPCCPVRRPCPGRRATRRAA